MLTEQHDAGKFKYSMASYWSPVFTVEKKGRIQVVNDIQELNRVTIRDSALPP